MFGSSESFGARWQASYGLASGDGGKGERSADGCHAWHASVTTGSFEMAATFTPGLFLSGEVAVSRCAAWLGGVGRSPGRTGGCSRSPEWR